MVLIELLKKELEIISRAKSTVSIRMGFLFEGESKFLKDKFKNLLKKGIEINILAAEYCYIDDKKIDVLAEFEDCGVNILKADIPFVKLIIRDGIEMIHIFF
ncbi:hypothetical protein [Methanobrevibacter arboriphilus]|uniref:hypothetical protein n=1 Tax=Methanobrevibacter arboriphilus TaxID=39441 RepID=UPI001CDA6ECF|nr:hypothetical protein [Methanobrevibacter arboriphilus]